MADIDEQRARRWRRAGRRVRSIDRAGAFIDDVGFAVLFGSKSPLPCLWDVVSDHPFEEWDTEAQLVWAWKDELPLRGLAYYGSFLQGKNGFLALDLVRDLYRGEGRPDDFRAFELSEDARRVAEVLLVNGPTPTDELREATGLMGKVLGRAFSKAVVELGRAMLVTHYGVDDSGGGWPSAVLELTSRAFDVGGSGSPARAARRYLATMIAAEPRELARAFGWSTAEAREALDGIVAGGEATASGKLYVVAA